jgi:protein-tyrosine-phosphatase
VAPPDDEIGAAVPIGVDLLVICTGNAARSVMAGFMLDALSEAEGLGLRVATAGTHAVDGQPMSMRTRVALSSVPAVADAPVARHRSHQLKTGDLVRADLVVGMEADHVRYVRRQHPEAAARTATIRRLSADLSPGPAPLAERVGALGLADVALHSDEDVSDPAGRDEEVYVACAHQLWDLCVELAARI